MKHNLLKSVIISVILLMGVSNAWGKTIYLYTSDINWASDNAVLFVWSWKDDNQGVATKMTSATTNLYKADIADNHNKIIFMRMKNGSTEISWGDNLWNRTQGDQAINNETPCFKLTAWGQDGSKECTGTWGKISYDAHIYLDNSVANWSETTKEFMIGHSSYSDTYTMTQILDTKLYYLAFSDIWHGYWDYGFIGVTSHWGPYNNQDITTRIKSATKRTGTRGDQVLNGTKLFVPENANNDATLNKFDYNSYNDLNHTQTIKAQVKYGGETNPAYQQVISPATITATTKYFDSENSANGNGSLTIDRDETNPANLTKTVNAAYTSTVTLSYTNLHEAYEFMDWWDDTNSKTISTSAECTYVATKATTIYARFKAKEDYTRTVYLDARNWNADNPRYAVYAFYGENEGQNKWIDMTPAYGTNWYYTCEVSAKYSHVIFCRMNPEKPQNAFDDVSRWGQTNDLLVVLDLDEKNCFTPSGDPTEQGGKTYNGNWGTPPTFTVTLAGTDYGTYTVTCGEQEITVSNQTQTITNVPVGTTLTITNIQPNAGYDQTMVYKSGDGNYTEFGPEKTLTVTANTIISEDFRTTEEHDIYLKITANSDTYWINGNNEALPRILFVHGTNGEDQYTYPLGNLEEKIKSFEKVAQNDDFKIYKITAPIGYHSFFLYPPHTYDASAPFDHKIIPDDPTKNCYELIDNETVGNGRWIDPHFTVTLKPTAIGQFTFEYNGQRYTNHVDKNVVFDVLLGDTIILVESGHYNSNVYNGDLNKNGQLLNFPEDKIHVINENTEFKEDFVVKKGFAPITVYLRIPKVLDDEGTGHWQSGKERDIDDNDGDGDSDFMDFANFVWLDGVGAHEQVIAQSTFDNAPDRVEPRHFRMQPVDVNDEIYNIYTCTILDSCFYGLKFEYKHIDGDHGRGGIHQTQSQNLVNFDQTNCFTITGKNGNDFTGYWDKYTEVGDYRMLYVEQEVAKGTGEDNWKTVINRTKCHPSDIIKKGVVGQKDTVSLHINTAGNNPEVILQQYQTVDGVSKWVDIEAHMVNGPLKADAGMAMINGRRNAGADSGIDDFVYDDGIEVIKNDDKYQDNSNDQGVSYKGSGVWNFIITQSEDTAVLDMTNIHRYNGKYYIRVEYKGRYWETYRISSQEMTYSSYSEQNSRFSHYFCEWLEATGERNVKFVVANEYSSAISDTLIADRTDLWGKTLEAEQIMVSEDGILPENANVRFSWEDMTNKLHRAYLRGATHTEDRFLVVRGSGDGKLKDIDGDDLTAGAQYSDRYGLQANEEIFKDNNNWIYYTDVQMKPSAQVKIIAEYDEIDQYFIGSSDTWSTTVLQGTADNAYPIRLLYDFKINRLISAYVPRGNTIDTEIEFIATNLMLIRRNNGEATQLAFANNNMSDVGQQAYGVLELTEDSLHDSSQPLLKRSLYWISFPFDVYLPDAISSGKYGVHWLIQSYNGARRAEEGLWLESEPFWDFHWDNDITLEAGKGYVLEIDIAQLDADGLLPDNGTIGFYFPSKQAIQNHIVQYPNPVTVEVDPHECTINRPIPGYGDRRIRDSHWNVIGVPSYVNAGADFSEHVENNIDGNALKFYYQWDGEQDKYTPIQSKNDKTQESNFHTLHAYMVQFAGDLQWNSVVAEGQGQPAAIAARRMSDYRAKEHNLTLELQQNGSLLDHTYVTLQEEDVTAAFDFNYDLCKIKNAGANVYSLIATETGNVEVAGNVLPVESAVVPLGVVAATAGEYTFAMPDGTDGIIVELIDYETNTRTNLLLSDYTVNLPAGTNDTRFALHVQPSKVTTSIENGAVEGESGKVRKLVIDGKLLLQKGNTLYDAQGHIVR